MADSWLPKPGDYNPPTNGDLVPDAFKRPAEPEAAGEPDAQPEQAAAADQPETQPEAVITPYPPAPPTVSGTDVTQSVYLGGITQ